MDPAELQQHQRGPGDDDDEVKVDAARAVKLPPFWKENPVLWFAQAEAAFHIAHVTNDSTKFQHLVVHLDQDVLPFISDIIVAPPERGKFEALKARIISAFDESNETKLRKLLRGSRHTNEKPSHILQRLRHMANGQCTENILRTLFMEQLPDYIGSILAISEVTDLTKLALQADKILEVSKADVATVTSTPARGTRHTTVDAELAELRDMVKNLSLEVSKLRSRRDRSRSRSRNRGSRVKVDNGLCYYHSRFQAQARKCRQPCTWVQNRDSVDARRPNSSSNVDRSNGNAGN
ncbi:PREDICTED: uncharacterized protein LOC106792598 [Polistes canadensis]|uniref:uncharacterized protein LOC106792598 n=1 Tax=Polistes canadensis TaxID=91411 RepID=UPI000718E40B|nr:PREDICTED: uncharacterized protein LOC106792598 [Polistes canadensis]